MDVHEFPELIGKLLVRADQGTNGDGDDEVVFVTDTGEVFKQYHSQDCCENVSVESIVGDLSDLIGHPLLQAEAVTHTGDEDSAADWPEGVSRPQYTPESYTWTFYKFATIKGSVTIRWYGTSNGYYSESVALRKIA